MKKQNRKRRKGSKRTTEGRVEERKEMEMGKQKVCEQEGRQEKRLKMEGGNKRNEERIQI